MKKIVLLSIVMLFFVVPHYGQNGEFAPNGSYWKYSWNSWGFGYIAITKVMSDTVVNGKNFKKVHHTLYSTTDPPYTRFFFLNRRNDSIFEGLDNPLFLYHFQARVGDTIRVRAHPRDYVVADSIGTLAWAGTNRRVVYYSRYCQRSTTSRRYDMRLVENVGILGNRQMPSLSEGLTWFISDCVFSDPIYYRMICYREGNFTYPSNDNCSETVAVEDLLLAEQVSILPNPVTENLQFQFPMNARLQRIEWMNCIGQKTLLPITTTDINVSNIPNGTYFLTFIFDNQRVTKKVLVQH
jgi:Secretion system C-terminal sorting domain